jgi:hypothetical protein
VKKSHAALTAAVLIGLLGACATPAVPPQLTDEQVCLSHFENDPLEQARCRLDAGLRSGTPPDADPRQLPYDTGAPS